MKGPEILGNNVAEQYRRIDASSVERVISERQEGEEVLLTFQDGSGDVLLNLVQLAANPRYLNAMLASSAIGRELVYLDDATGKAPDGPDTQEFRQASGIYRLEHAMVRHWVARSNGFVSKVKNDDREIIGAVATLDQRADNYEFRDELTRSETGLIIDAVAEKRKSRTLSLLGDFQHHIQSLPMYDIWVVGQSIEAGDRFAARLINFTIHENGRGRTVEPIIQAADGTNGLVPDGYYIQPLLHLRLPS